MAQVAYLAPGTSVFIIMDNRVHAAKVDAVQIKVTRDFNYMMQFQKIYTVTQTFGEGMRGMQIDTDESNVAETREALVAKL